MTPSQSACGLRMLPLLLGAMLLCSGCATSAPPTSCPVIPPLSVPISTSETQSYSERLWRALLPSVPMPTSTGEP